MNPDLWYPLPPDMNVWNTAITENISRKIPEITQYISSITWSKLDPATGDGDGLIELLGGIASAPVTIRQMKLAPIDIIAAKDSSGNIKFYPLSPLFLQKLYADNVVAEPVDNMADRDESYEGPGKRIQHIKTVDSVKYASAEAAQAMLDEIVKSASVANWMAENMPETLYALYNKSQEVTEKTAGLLDNMPDLIVISKEGDNFYTNGELTSFEKVASFCKSACIPMDNRTALMNGIPLVIDEREKVASLHIPTEQEVVLGDPDANVFADGGVAPTESPEIALTTAYLKDGRTEQGVVFTPEALGWARSRAQVDYQVPADDRNFVVGADVAPRDDEREKANGRELFISANGYGFGYSIKTNTRLKVTEKFLIDSSNEDEPVMGKVGIFIAPHGVLDFGRVEEVTVLGAAKQVRIYSYIYHNINVIKMRNERFYEVEDHILPLAPEGQVTDTVTMSGINGVVSRDNEGNIIIDGISHSIVNCPYALMSKYAMAFDDACDVIDVALSTGRCIFEVSAPFDKLAAENDNPDKTKGQHQPRKGTATGSDDDADAGQGKDGVSEEDIFPTQMSQVTPESAMSQQGPAQADMPQQGTSPDGAVHGAPQQAPNAFGNMPVNSTDMENVVNLNSTPVMDAYMMANLASTNLSSKETLLKASDSILNALSQLSQLLFLVRQGQLDFISEADIQVSMNKLTDVAQALGISTTQIAA